MKTSGLVFKGLAAAGVDSNTMSHSRSAAWSEHKHSFHLRYLEIYFRFSGGFIVFKKPQSTWKNGDSWTIQSTRLRYTSFTLNVLISDFAQPYSDSFVYLWPFGKPLPSIYWKGKELGWNKYNVAVVIVGALASLVRFLLEAFAPSRGKRISRKANFAIY